MAFLADTGASFPGACGGYTWTRCFLWRPGSGKIWVDVGIRLHAIKKPGDRVIVFVDANCRIPDLGMASAVMGSVLEPAWRSNFVSDAFVAFATEHSLHIANTYADNLARQSPIGTLYTSKGSLLACDYVLQDFATVVQPGSMLAWTFSHGQ